MDEKILRETVELVDRYMIGNVHPDKKRALEILKSLAELFLSVKGMPEKLLEEDIKVECPVKDGLYWKILIQGQVVALVPTKDLAIELVKKCFSRNQTIDLCRAWWVKKVDEVKIIQLLANTIEFDTVVFIFGLKVATKHNRIDFQNWAKNQAHSLCQYLLEE